MPTGILWDKVKKSMEQAEWQDDWDGGDGQLRSVFLGTVFSLYPSGKYYLPFACSNLDPCPDCLGKGEIPLHRPKRKDYHRARRKSDRLKIEFVRLQQIFGSSDAVPESFMDKLHEAWHRSEYYRPVRHCELCDGMGSHEAKLDSDYQEELDREAAEHGYFIMSGEGNPCDLFVAECRDLPEEDEEDETDEVLYNGSDQN